MMLLKGGCVVTSDRKFYADVLIEKNIIKQIGQNINPSSETQVIDCTNKLIIPGGIDPNTNFNLSPNQRALLQIESKAALAGGTTTIINCVDASKGSDEALKNLQSEIKSKLFCNYGLCVDINANNNDAIRQMENLVRSNGINTFHLTIGNEVTPNVVAILKKCKELNCILRLKVDDNQQCRLLEEELLKNGVNGPEGFVQARCLESELESLYKILKINYAFPCAIIVPQIMNDDVGQIVSQMKKQGRPIFSETITAALAVSSDRYFSNSWEEAASIITDPPLRNGQETAIIRGIHNGDIDMLASQHTTINDSDRSVGRRDFANIPRGLIGAEERLILLWDRGVKSGIISECEFVAATSTNAAKIFNLYPERGHIGVGSVADIVIWNPDLNRTISSSSQHLKMETHLFEGLACRGAPELVIVNGEVKSQRNEIIGNASGEKLELKNNCKMLADKLTRFEAVREFGKLSVKREGCENNSAPIFTPMYKETKTSVETNNYATEIQNDSLKIQRPLTSGGSRNMQDSSFSLSGSQIDDSKPTRTSIRTNHPPGGKSSLVL